MDIRAMLAALSKLQKASGAAAAAKDTAALAELANGDDLAARIESIDIVQYFLDELRASATDKGRFDEALKDMKKPGLLSDAQAKAIAKTFLETKAAFRSKAAAIEAIRDARARDDRLGDKLKAS